MNKGVKILILIIVLVLVFVGGLFLGKFVDKRMEPLLDINKWDVKTYTVDGVVVYEANDTSTISEEQIEGWNKLLKELSVKGYKRHKTEGSTAHSKSIIKMKNGDTYIIEDLGCLNQINITYPDGNTVEYYGYY